MRLWSIHPKYLDAAGLVALWREGLLAQQVLKGKTKGYKNHPQLERFKKQDQPVKAIAKYLLYIYREAKNRNYNFNLDKIKPYYNEQEIEIVVTEGQIEYEYKHLLNKLEKRSPDRYNDIKDYDKIDVHPLFTIIPGKIAKWERI